MPTLNTVAFSPDGALLASREPAGVLKPEGALKLWDVATGREVRTLGGPGRGLRAVAFSPDGRRLAAETGRNPFAEGPGEIAVWDLATGQKAVTLQGRSVAFSPTAAGWPSATGKRSRSTTSTPAATS